jgi:hypothetical protein
VPFETFHGFNFLFRFGHIRKLKWTNSISFLKYQNNLWWNNSSNWLFRLAQSQKLTLESSLHLSIWSLRSPFSILIGKRLLFSKMKWETLFIVEMITNLDSI